MIFIQNYKLSHLAWSAGGYELPFAWNCFPSAVSAEKDKIREEDFDLISLGPAKSATMIALCNPYKKILDKSS